MMNQDDNVVKFGKTAVLSAFITFFLCFLLWVIPLAFGVIMDLFGNGKHIHILNKSIKSAGKSKQAASNDAFFKHNIENARLIVPLLNTVMERDRLIDSRRVATALKALNPEFKAYKINDEYFIFPYSKTQLPYALFHDFDGNGKTDIIMLSKTEESLSLISLMNSGNAYQASIISEVTINNDCAADGVLLMLPPQKDFVFCNNDDFYCFPLYIDNKYDTIQVQFIFWSSDFKERYFMWKHGEFISSEKMFEQ